MSLGLALGVRTQGLGWPCQEMHHCTTHDMVALRAQNCRVYTALTTKLLTALVLSLYIYTDILQVEIGTAETSSLRACEVVCLILICLLYYFFAELACKCERSYLLLDFMPYFLVLQLYTI